MNAQFVPDFASGNAQFVPDWATTGGGGTTYYQSCVGALVWGGTISRTAALHRSFGGSLNCGGTLIERFTGHRSLNGIVTFTGFVSGTTGLSQVLDGALHLAGTIRRHIGKGLGGCLASVGHVIRKATRHLTGQLSFHGQPSTSFRTTRQVAGSFSFGGLVSTVLNPIIEELGIVCKLIGVGIRKIIGGPRRWDS